MLRQAPIDPAGCPLCGHDAARVVGRRDRKGRPLRTVLCEGCGLVRCDPLPGASAVERYYADEYRHDYKGAGEPRPRHCHREMLRAIARVEALRPLYTPGMRVLDVGSGAGFFPYAARRAGIACDGIEPNVGYARFGRERLQLGCLRVGTLASLAADGQGPSYDLVTIHHVLEHLLDPVASMRQLAALVRPGGRVLVEVPDIEADWHTPGRLFHAAHLYWFSEATLAALALRCGLEPVQVLRVPPCGHLCMLLRRPSRLHAPAGWRVPLAGNAQRVAAALGGRSLRRYLLSAAPYRRAAGRLALRFGEWRAVRGVRDATAVVDSLCTSWLASRASHGTVMLAR